MFIPLYHGLLASLLPNHDHRRLAGNVIALSILQLVNYLLPLLIVPHLLQTLGLAPFGLYAFATAVVTYFVLLTDYGFNFTATRAISVNRNDHIYVSRVYAEVLVLRLLLSSAGLAILTLIVMSIQTLRNDALIYYLTFGNVVGHALMPVWLFQGMERMKFITWITVIPKIITTACIFVFVREPGDLPLTPLLIASGFISSGVIATVVVRYGLGIRFKIPEKQGLIRQLNDGWPVFVSNLSISLYTVSTTVLLRAFTSEAIVGVYAAAEKMVRAVTNLYSPIAQGLFPFISRRISQSGQKGIPLIYRTARNVAPVTAFFSIALFIIAPQLSSWLFEAEPAAATNTIRILALLPLAVSMSNIFAIQGLYSYGHHRKVLVMLLCVGGFHLLHATLLINILNGTGAAISLLFTEILVTGSAWIIFYRSVVKKNQGTHLNENRN